VPSPYDASVRALVVVVLLAFLWTAAALGGRGDPQKRFTPADQARARAMLLRTSDFPTGVRATRQSSGALSFDCAALDLSGLTLTGEADSPNFSTGFVNATSASDVYMTLVDANASWRRSTSSAGVACVRATLRAELEAIGVQLDSLRRLAFPRVSDRTVAYRIVATAHPQGVSVRVFVDLVALQRSRAQVSVLLTSGLVPPVRADELRYARTLATRAKTAMRGA